jgi:hypothetical protein
MTVEFTERDQYVTRTGWLARTVLDAGEPAGAQHDGESHAVLRLPVEQVSVWDRRDLLRD